MKKSDLTNGSMFPLTPGPSPRWGEGKVNTRVNSLAPSGERVVRRTADRVRGRLENIRFGGPPAKAAGLPKSQ